MKEIPLSNSPLLTIVDDEDYEWVVKRSWHITKDGYARTTYVGHNNQLLQRQILRRHGLLNEAILVDHVNGNRLDNRKINFKQVNHVGNSANRRNVAGVSYHKHNRSWVAYINVNHKRYTIGYFRTEEAAKAARKAAERERREILG